MVNGKRQPEFDFGMIPLPGIGGPAAQMQQQQQLPAAMTMPTQSNVCGSGPVSQHISLVSAGSGGGVGGSSSPPRTTAAGW
jgi:hypothetical protein